MRTSHVVGCRGKCLTRGTAAETTCHLWTCRKPPSRAKRACPYLCPPPKSWLCHRADTVHQRVDTVSATGSTCKPQEGEEKLVKGRRTTPGRLSHTGLWEESSAWTNVRRVGGNTTPTAAPPPPPLVGFRPTSTGGQGGRGGTTPGCIAVCSWRRLLASRHLPLPFP